MYGPPPIGVELSTTHCPTQIGVEGTAVTPALVKGETSTLAVAVAIQPRALVAVTV